MDKKQRLMDLLLEQPPARTLVFVKSKRACDSLDDYLYNLKFPCTSIHGDRTQRERDVRPPPQLPQIPSPSSRCALPEMRLPGVCVLEVRPPPRVRIPPSLQNPASQSWCSPCM